MPFLFLQAGILLIGFSSYRGLGGLTVFDVMFLISFLFYVAMPRLWGEELRSGTGVAAGAVLAITGLVCSSLLNSVNVADAMLNISKFAFALYLLVFAIHGIARGWLAAERLVQAFVLSGAISGVGALVQVLGGIDGGEGGFFGPFLWGRATAFTEHPNELGLHCSMAVMFGVFGLRSRLISWSWSIAVGMSVIGLLLSASMTAAASVVSGLVVAAIIDAAQKRYRAVIVLGTVFLISAISVPVISAFGDESGNGILKRIELQLSGDVEETTVDMRLITYTLAVEKIIQNPVVGVGSSAEDLNIIDDYVHNIFLRAWFEGGFFSMLGVFILLGSVSVSAVAGVYGCRSEFVYVISTILTLVMGLVFSPAFYQRVVWLSVGVLAYLIFNKDCRRNAL